MIAAGEENVPESRQGTPSRPAPGVPVGRLSRHDPLHDLLSQVLTDRLHVTTRPSAFLAFRLPGLHETYCYQEASTGTLLVCKFYGDRFGLGKGLAALVAQQEYDNLNILRGYGLVGSPHHVVEPLGLLTDLNAAVVVEHVRGDELTRSLHRAALHGAGAHLLRQLGALAHYLATQHNRTAIRCDVDFTVESDYFETVLSRLGKRGRIGQWDVDELLFLRDLWARRPRMWSDRRVWLHGDATPSNFLFGDGRQVFAIDLERMRRGDRTFDVGRICAEIQHAFMGARGSKSRAEPYITHFLTEYCRHFPDSHATFTAVTSRTPFYMALTLLRITQNGHIAAEDAVRLVRQAKRLLRTS